MLSTMSNFNHTTMATNEHDRNQANQPGQNPTGTRNQDQHPTGGQQSYGQDQDTTNLNRDQQHVNAANKPMQSHTPDPTNRGESRRNQEEPNRRDVDPVIPEVPLREEKREEKIPKAGEKTTNSQGNDGAFNIDDSSKFSE
jgi:hypothetical protein